ncbi:hypothetical protein CHUAL_011309 [Chamberlinius hualienensis]
MENKTGKLETSNEDSECENYVLAELLNDVSIRDEINVSYINENAVGVFVSSKTVGESVLKSLSLANCLTLAVIYRLFDLICFLISIGLSVSYLKSQSKVYFEVTLMVAILPSIFSVIFNISRIIYNFKILSATEKSIKIAICFMIFPSLGAHQWWKFNPTKDSVLSYKQTVLCIKLTDELSASYAITNSIQWSAQFLAQWYIMTIGHHSGASSGSHPESSFSICIYQHSFGFCNIRR